MSDSVRLSTALADRYRVDRELGHGGMATVYLAEDIRHHRKVAIKVLYPELSAVLGSERFLKEIELTAGLQHPHILPLFDSGTADRLLYYVMPYVAGESLRVRLAREKQLPVADAVRIAEEVAGALDYAHRHGVVHRDIKPENILLHDGRALVADFGIALAVQQAGGDRMTQTGISLGTPSYMSPEQAMGEREVTAQSDIYSLGCVTYEMLAGQPPFTGPTAQAVVAGVLTEAPRPLRTLRHTVPEPVEAAVLQALEKLPADRFRSAAEYAQALATKGPVRRDARTARALGTRPRARLVAAFGVLWAATAGLAAWALLRTPPVRSHPVIRYTLVPPPDHPPVDLAGSTVAVSPDGSRLVFLGRSPSGTITLLLWNLDGGDPVPIPGTENGGFPFFSPDGQWIGFLIGSQLRRVSLSGGGSSVIGEIPASAGRFLGATWTEKAEIIFSTFSGMGRIPVEGGSYRLLTPGNAGPPDALPGGEEVVAPIRSFVTSGQLAVINLATGKITPLNQRGANPRYVEPGFLAFTNLEGALLAVRFDPRRRRITSSPRQIAQGMILGINGVGRLGISRTGTVVHILGWDKTERQLLRVARSGLVKPLPAPNRPYWGPRIAPDGRRIAVVVGPFPSPPMDIWMYDLVLGTLSRVTSDSTSVNPEWSPDGRRVVYPRLGEVFRVVAETPDRSAPAESLYATPAVLFEAIPTRSGDTLITREVRSAGNDRDLILVPLKHPEDATPWAAGPGIQAEPALSPDGRWLAYSSDESGASEVYVRAFPGPGPRYQISTGGGLAPRWNPKGGELFLISRDSLVAVPIRSVGTSLEPGRPRALFAFRFALMTYHAPYDVAPDGSWFVAVGSTGAPEPVRGIRVVLNWFDQPWKE